MSTINIFQEKYHFPESSFIEYINLRFDLKSLEVKMQKSEVVYEYEILDTFGIRDIRWIYFNQQEESIGKFYNRLKKEKKINLINKI